MQQVVWTGVKDTNKVVLLYVHIILLHQKPDTSIFHSDSTNLHKTPTASRKPIRKRSIDIPQKAVAAQIR